MASGKTYLVGSGGLLRVYDHVTGLWSDRSIASQPYLTDVKTDPNNPDYAIICGLNYVAYTLDAGATVIPIMVNPTLIGRGFQIAIPESASSAIYICGAGNGPFPAIVKSTDGGVTYQNAVNGLIPAGGNQSLTIYFTNNLVGVVGHGEKVAKTIDGGANWTYFSLVTKEIISGVHISADEQTVIVVSNKKIRRSTNGGTSFSVVYTINTDPAYEGIALKYSHLSWLNGDDTKFWVSASNGPILYSADSGATWTDVFPANDTLVYDGRTIFASHFYTPTKGFIGINQYGNDVAAAYAADNAASSMTITLSNDYIPTSQISTAVWTLISVDIYLLVDCTDENNILYSINTDLGPVVNKVIKIEGSDNCWQVSLVEFDDQEITDVTIATNEGGYPLVFDDCVCCLPPVPPAPVKYTRVIPKPDRNFYQVTQSQCDVSSNIKFAEAYYRLFKNLKYGINSQCDTVDLNAIWIKKQLSDLAVINDPTACTITPVPTPIICPDPS